MREAMADAERHGCKGGEWRFERHDRIGDNRQPAEGAT